MGNSSRRFSLFHFYVPWTNADYYSLSSQLLPVTSSWLNRPSNRVVHVVPTVIGSTAKQFSILLTSLLPASHCLPSFLSLFSEHRTCCSCICSLIRSSGPEKSKAISVRPSSFEPRTKGGGISVPLPPDGINACLRNEMLFHRWLSFCLWFWVHGIQLHNTTREYQILDPRKKIHQPGKLPQYSVLFSFPVYDSQAIIYIGFPWRKGGKEKPYTSNPFPSRKDGLRESHAGGNSSVDATPCEPLWIFDVWSVFLVNVCTLSTSGVEGYLLQVHRETERKGCAHHVYQIPPGIHLMQVSLAEFDTKSMQGRSSRVDWEAKGITCTETFAARNVLVMDSSLNQGKAFPLFSHVSHVS